MIAESPTLLHTYILFFCIIIQTLVTLILVDCYLWKNKAVLVNSNNWVIENIFILFPFIIIICICIPALSLNYSFSPSCKVPEYSVNITGHQWYWDYSTVFNNTLIPTQAIYKNPDSFFADSCSDKSFFLPAHVAVKVSTTSDDVIHCVWIPGLGVKIDSIPGATNTTIINIKFRGITFGACAELCGVGHYNMPFTVISGHLEEVINYELYLIKRDIQNIYNIYNRLRSIKSLY